MEGERKAAEYIDIGARVLDGHCLFTVWAPSCERVELKLPGAAGRKVPMDQDLWGYWHAEIREVPGRYIYLLNGDLERPDPASHHQPEGVHGASAPVDHETYRWYEEGWKGIPLEDFIIYEIHVGTFTPEGTFEAVIPRLSALSDLGITAVELMPVSAFPGTRNWGYDGVYPFAVQNSYGGPDGLKRLIDACHAHGLAVVLDVVYNHLGPEGNYFTDFGPYFTDSYRTYWGDALNFDEAYSSEVRNYFVRNMIHWFERYHVDALRLDAVHAIFDRSAVHFLEELSVAAADFTMKRKRTHLLIAESDLNDPRIIRPRTRHGYGIDAQWSDDFHHALHALITGEHTGYYEDFGSTEHLRTVFQKGFYHTWCYSAYRKRFFGADPGGLQGKRFIVCTQNHDQVGNRPDGKRLCELVSFEALKLAAAVLLLSPFVPLLFMGQEYAEDAPFLYFVSHTEPALVQAVQEGRKREFEAFASSESFPDPQDEQTFLRSKLHWEERNSGKHGILLSLYRRLLYLRRTIPALRDLNLESVETWSDGDLLAVQRSHRGSSALIIMNSGSAQASWTCPVQGIRWVQVLNTASPEWDGPVDTAPETLSGGEVLRLSPTSLALFGT